MLVHYPRARHAVHRTCLYRQPVGCRRNQPPDPRPTQGIAPLVPEPQPRSTPPTRGITIDRERRTASVDGRLLALTYLEFEILAHLVARPRRVYGRAQLINEVWGEPAIGDARTVDVHIARLRHKLGTAHRAVIVTIRQVGYAYDPAQHPP
ncbi:winged helix-turn-helix domain-containing protein [Streptomyces sp. NPDC093261]|uniref:winged helix-turn-helix domain-containing protein n=1 Tax=Streptomyces sp. NPDC093261 TaxID=3366037 RepID=UPI00381E2441